MARSPQTRRSRVSWVRTRPAPRERTRSSSNSVAVSAGLERAGDDLVAPVAGDEDDGQVGELRNSLHELDPVGLGQHQVEQHQPGLLGQEDAPYLVGVAGDQGGEAGVGERVADMAQRFRVIVDHEDGHRFGLRAGPVGPLGEAPVLGGPASVRFPADRVDIVMNSPGILANTPRMDTTVTQYYVQFQAVPHGGRAGRVEGFGPPAHGTGCAGRKAAGKSGNWETEMDRLSESGAIAGSKEPRTCRAHATPRRRSWCSAQRWRACPAAGSRACVRHSVSDGQGRDGA